MIIFILSPLGDFKPLRYSTGNMAKKQDDQELITISEAARRFGLSPQYLRDIARSGRLKARKLGRDWLTTPVDVEIYIQSRSKKGAFREDIER
jgi:excisionase family DNA binding protein